MCGSGEVVVVVKAEEVVSNDGTLCQALNSFVETREAIEVIDCIAHC